MVELAVLAIFMGCALLGCYIVGKIFEVICK